MLHSRLLFYLDEVARAGSIRKAAERLNIASSAVNRQIIALEQAIGTPLFTRLHKRMQLTAAGEILLAHVRKTMSDHDGALARIEALKGLLRGEVTIATMHTLASELLPPVTGAFLHAHPDARVRARVIPDIVGAVLAGEADIGLGFNLAPSPALHVQASVPFRFGAVVAADHPLARRPVTTIAGCALYPLILPEPGMSLRPTLERGLINLPEQPRIAVVTNSIEYMKRCARLGLGVAFLTAVDVRQECARGELVYVQVRDPLWKPDMLVLACRSRPRLDGLAALLLDEIAASLALFSHDVVKPAA